MTTITESIMANKNNLVRVLISKAPDNLSIHLNSTTEAYVMLMGRTPDNTANINVKKMKRMLSRIEEVCEEPIKLEIVPVGFKQMCHNNCAYYCSIDDNFETRLGYNIVSSEGCNAISLEIHTVLYHKVTKTYYDITPDYLLETSKWFIPFKSNIKYSSMFMMVGRKFDFGTIINGKPNVKCRDLEGNEKFKVDDMIDFLNMTNNMRFHFI